MKKTACIILSAIMMVVTFISPIAAEDVLKVKLDRRLAGDKGAQYIVVEGETDKYYKGEPLFIKVFKKGLDESKMALTDYAIIGQGECATESGSFELSEEFGGESGEYTVIVNSMEHSLSTDIYIPSLDAINSLIEKMNGENPVASDIVKEINENNKELVFETEIFAELDENVKKSVIEDMLSEDESFNMENIYERFNRYTLLNAVSRGESAVTVKKALEYYENSYLKLSEMTVSALADSLSEAVKEKAYSMMLGEDYNTVYDIRKRYFESVIVTAVNETVTYLDIYDILEEYKEEMGIETQVSKLTGSTKSKVMLYLVNQKSHIDSLESLISFLDKGIANPNEVTKNETGSSAGGGGGATGGKKVSADPPKASDEIPSFSVAGGLTDLASVPWASTAINSLYSKGIISGKGNGIFAPADNITRAEIVKMLVVASGDYDNTAKSEFEDLSGHWASAYVASAYNKGYVIGVNESIFGADEFITRQDVAVILYRMMQVNAKTETIENVTKTFTDHGEISGYAVRSVEMLGEYGILNGFEDGSFKPKNLLTRAEAAVLINSFMESIK